MKRGEADTPTHVAKPYCFFAHVAFSLQPGAHATPQATANLLIEVDHDSLGPSIRKKRLKASALTGAQKVELAGELAMAAALDYLKSEDEFSRFPAQRFVNFDAVPAPTYISVRPPATKVFRSGARLSRLAESDADKLRGEPRSVRYPDIEERLASHPFLRGMTRHHIELLALCAMPTQFEANQIIFLEGEPANGFYLIESGKIVLEGKTRDSASVVIDTVAAREPLGWSWLFPPYLWHFDARATEKCKAICLSGIMLRQHREDDATLSHELLQRISEVVVRRLQAARSKLIARK